MTFTELVDDVMDRLNLTSDNARTRVGGDINARYRMVTSAIGVQTSRRSTDTIDLDSTVDTDLPEVTVNNLEKVLKVWTNIGNRVKILPEETYDEITATAPRTALPTRWAVKRIGPGEVIIVLDGFPVEPFTLSVEGYDNADTLSGSLEPYFPADFHDILISGAMSDELFKMEKPQLSARCEQDYQTRLSDLRMFLAKSAYMDIYQSKTKPRRWWTV